ncbi:MAG: hypothetical protein Q8P76_03005 [bacterium]|nr:hypothetical protein [bacterium]
MSKLLHWVAVVFWALSIVALVLAWVAVYRRGLVIGLEPLAWYWNSLIFGVLSLGSHQCTEGKCMPTSSM